MALVLVAASAACATAPAMRAPLRDRLAKADTPAVEDAVRACLTSTGWKVDPVGSLSGGANVVSARKDKGDVQVYIHAPEDKPRITGGPDDGDPLWKCLPQQLSGEGNGDKDSEGDGGKGDKDGASE